MAGDGAIETTTGIPLSWMQMFSSAAFAALFGAAGAIIVATTGFMNKDREMDIEMVKVALNILSDPKNMTDERDGQRIFALNLLQKFSGVRVEESDESNWRSSNFVKVFSSTQDACSDSVSNLLDDLNKESFEKYWIAGCATHINYENYNEVRNYLSSLEPPSNNTLADLPFTPEDKKEIKRVRDEVLQRKKDAFMEALGKEAGINSLLPNDLTSTPVPSLPRP